MSGPTRIPWNFAEGPDYQEPWQASAFACAIELSRTGVFSRSDWTHVLSEEIRRAPAQPGESAVSAYYRQVLNALERLIHERTTISRSELLERIDAWRQAYLATPHGHAVELASSSRTHNVHQGLECAAAQSQLGREK